MIVSPYSSRGYYIPGRCDGREGLIVDEDRGALNEGHVKNWTIALKGAEYKNFKMHYLGDYVDHLGETDLPKIILSEYLEIAFGYSIYVPKIYSVSYY